MITGCLKCSLTQQKNRKKKKKKIEKWNSIVVEVCCLNHFYQNCNKEMFAS